MFTHQAINNAKAYAEIIDRVISSLYTKKGKVHLVLDVQTKGAVKFEDMFGFGGVMPLLREFIDEEKLNISTENIDSKTNVQSKGIIEVIAENPEIIILFATLIAVIGVVVAGGAVEYKQKLNQTNFSVKTEGIINRLVEFYKNKTKNKAIAKLVGKTVENMDVKSPKEIEKVVESLLKKR
jgi:hypothetical protein